MHDGLCVNQLVTLCVIVLPGELQQFHRSAGEIAPESLPVSWPSVVSLLC